MRFGNRRISEISDHELIDLIGQDEDLWTEFKVGPYPSDYEFQICRSVTAMANADGGYIFFGVRERTGRAVDLVGVYRPCRFVERIEKCVADNIEPDIRNLEVKPRAVLWRKRSIDLVIVHIPPSDLDFHGFNCNGANGTNNFAIRFGASVKPLTTYELIMRAQSSN